MERVLTADIFFFVTTIAVVTLSIVAVIALIYIILILRDVRGISQRLREEVDAFTHDMEELRETIRSKKAFLGPVVSFATILIKRMMRSRKKHDPHDEDEFDY